jgi:riboflavin synthase
MVCAPVCVLLGGVRFVTTPDLGSIMTSWSPRSDQEMFTGLVQAVGHLELTSHGVWIRLASGGLGSLALGDSIAVDGVCLTVAERDPSGRGFRADVSEETLQRTTLGRRARERAMVNLEPALKLSDRLGGHLVSGHVDGLGTVTDIEALDSSWRLSIAWQDPDFGKYICDKASIAVDGISLTVAGWEDGGVRFWLAVIPHTWQSTTLHQRRVGDWINLEADVLARYLERLLADRLSDGAPAPAEALTSDWLTNHGWTTATSHGFQER